MEKKLSRSTTTKRELIERSCHKQQSDNFHRGLSKIMYRGTTKHTYNKTKTISVIKVNVKQMDLKFEFFPIEEEIMEEIREYILTRIGENVDFEIPKYIAESFNLCLGDKILSREYDSLTLGDSLGKLDTNIEEKMIGDVLSLEFRINDLSAELDFLTLFIPKAKQSQDVFLLVVRQKKENEKKKRIKNRYLRIQKTSETECAVEILNTKLSVKESYSSSKLKLEKKDSTIVSSTKYWPVRFLRDYHGEMNFQDTLDPDLTAADVFFLDPHEVEAFFEIINPFIKLMQMEYEKKSTIKVFNQIPNPTSISAPDINRGSFLKDPNVARSTTIASVMEKKKNLLKDKTEFAVKSYALFGRKKDKIIKISEDFDIVLFKKNKGLPEFYKTISLKDGVDIDRDGVNSPTVKITIKKNKKIKKFLFKDDKESSKFIELMEKIQDFVHNSGNSFLTENINNEKERYSWLMKVNGETKKFNSGHGESKRLKFNVINMTKSKEAQTAHIDLEEMEITFTSTQGKLRKKLSIKNIVYCEVDYLDPTLLTLITTEKKQKVLFSDAKSRLKFESALYCKLFPLYTITEADSYKNFNARLFATTFNSGSADPPLDMSSWLGKSLDSDIIAIGMQESDTALWLQAIQNYYEEEKKFVLITVVTMWEMSLCLFVLNKYAKFITNVEVDTKSTGFAKVIGNKGGVAVTFRMLQTSFCLISCHLAAKPDKQALRKANFNDIVKGLRFGDKSIEAAGLFDHFIFMGDMNFRVDHDFFKAVDVIKAGKWEVLKQYDQLKKSKEKENFMTILDVKEPDITFQPTYRRNREDSGYSNKKNQCPSWTDRIMFKSRNRKNVKVTEYNSLEDFYSSDHRPVYCFADLIINPPYVSEMLWSQEYEDKKGVIKFKKIELIFDFDTRDTLDDTISKDKKVGLEFRAEFLSKTSTTVFTDVKDSNKKIEFKEDMTPLLYVIIPDMDFLKQASLLVIVKANPIVIGTADINLGDLIDKYGSKVDFETSVHLFGAKFGTLKGTFSYEITNA